MSVQGAGCQHNCSERKKERKNNLSDHGVLLDFFTLRQEGPCNGWAVVTLGTCQPFKYVYFQVSRRFSAECNILQAGL